MDFKAVQFETD